MIPQAREQILYALNKIPKIFEDVSMLFDVSNYCIHTASIYQDSDSITMAVVTYALAKMVSRYKTEKSEDFDKLKSKIIEQIDASRASLEKENYPAYRKGMKGIVSTISAADKDLKLYIEQVIEKAKIKKGSGLYEHGISAERAAKLMGISVWEMMNYIGKTQIIDEAKISADVKEKIKLAKQLFNFS
jgi:hypothetical protein